MIDEGQTGPQIVFRLQDFVIQHALLLDDSDVIHVVEISYSACLTLCMIQCYIIWWGSDLCHTLLLLFDSLQACQLTLLLELYDCYAACFTALFSACLL